MIINAILKTDKVRGQKYCLTKERTDRLEETVKNYLEENTKFEVKSVEVLW